VEAQNSLRWDMGTLYYGDNLDILKRYIADESVDLVYLDPPFNSAQSYNAFFHEKDGTEAASQIRAFEDTWSWNIESQKVYDELTMQAGKVSEVLVAFRTFLGTNDMMAYLAMMAPRLVELKRVLKPTGSLYLHCDPTASHYLKILCDAVFGLACYRNEIIWQRTTAGKPIFRNLPKNSDTIFWYSKTEEYLFKPIFLPLTEEDKATFNRDDNDGRGPYNTQPIINPGDRPNLKYIYKDANGKLWPSPKTGWRFNEERMRQLEKDGRLVFGKTSIREKYYLNEREAKGKQLPNIWTDIPIVSGDERLGYPTQKPVALLERIIKASSNEGDTVLDPFCGCGTTIDAAEKLKRKWIGIDITQLATSLIKNRLRDTYGEKIEIKTMGEPVSVQDAIALAERDKYQFQWWALGLKGVDARPVEQKKGADHGIDGKILFRDDPRATKPEQIIIQVKGGHTSVKDVRDLRGVLDREKAAIGVLITLEEPTKPMKEEAASMGFYTHQMNGQKFPKLQLRTIKELMEGRGIERPSNVAATDETFKKAKARGKKDEQTTMF
jgi:DNA modification methylase